MDKNDEKILITLLKEFLNRDLLLLFEGSQPT
jgi:hypothetical protein